MPTNRFCVREECYGNGLADWRPVLELKPKGWRGKPAKLYIGIGVCSGCKEVMLEDGVDHILTEQIWDTILKAMLQRGNAKPHKKSTLLSFEIATDANLPSKFKDDE